MPDGMDVNSEEFKTLIATLVEQQVSARLKEAEDAVADHKSKKTTVKKPKIPKPADYNGDETTIQEFRMKVENYLDYYEDEYNNDKERIQMVVGCLTKTASSWYNNWRLKNKASEVTFESFWKQFVVRFTNPELKLTTKSGFIGGKFLQKKGQSVRNFEVFFTTKADLAELPEDDRIMHFHKGLQPHLQKALVSTSLNRKDFDSFVAQVVEIESNYQYTQINTNLTPQLSSSGSNSLQSKQQNRFSGNNNHKRKVRSDEDGNVKVSLERDAKKKTPFVTKELQEKRMSEKKCLKCGLENHMAKQCKVGWKIQDSEKSNSDASPKVSNTHSAEANNKIVSSDHYIPVKPLLLVPVQIRSEGHVIHVLALLDSGCSIDLIDSTLVKKATIDTIELDRKINLISDIGATQNHNQVGKVTAVTTEIPMSIGYDQLHQEERIFGVTTLGGIYSVVLSRHWLDEHNPSIDWPVPSISFPKCGDECIAKNCDSTEMINCINSNTVTPSNSTPLYFNTTIISPTQNFGQTKTLPIIPKEYEAFKDVFDDQKARRLPPHRPGFDAYIELKDPTDLPPIRPIIPLSREKDSFLKKCLDEEVEKGNITQKDSPIATSVFLVSKAGGGWRPCVNYVELNKRTKRILTPLPRIDEIIDRMHGAKTWTKIDLQAAFNQLRMKEGEEWKTSFRCKYGQYESLVMGFGTTNAPSFFQKWMNHIFRDLLDVCVVVYLDDICIFSENPTIHTKHVSEVLKRLEDNNLFAKLSKCIFGAREIEFLGFRLGVDGLSMNPQKVEAIRNWPIPKNVTDVLSFLGFIGFYRRFIQGFAKIATGLTNLLRKDVEFTFGLEAKNAFEALKAAACTAPILRHVDLNLPFTMETDASDFAMGAVLLQQPASSTFKHPVAFFSKKFVSAEVRYTIADKELLAIVRACEEWRQWLLSSPFTITICTDHKNLRYFRTKQIHSARHFQWQETLEEFNYELIHKRGVENRIADLLSRRGDHAFTEGEKAQCHSDVLLPEKVWKSSTAVWMEPKTVAGGENSSSDDSSGEDVIPDESEDSLIEVTDDSKKLLITKMRHDSVLAGHFGVEKTLALIKRDYTWKGIRSYVKEYVKSCECKRNKVAKHKPFGLLTKMSFSTKPWSQLSLDFVVKLPLSNGFDAQLVVCDRGFTKGAHFIGTTGSIDAKGVANLLFKHVFRYHGLPDNIISDRGPAFVSEVWKFVFKILKVKISLSSAFHPQTDGQTESTNAIWEQLIRNYVNYLQDDWESYNHLLEIAYNNATHSGLGCSPWFAEKGYNPRVDYLVSPSNSKNTVDIAKHLARLKDIQEQLVTILEDAQTEYKKYADRKRIRSPFAVGQKVYLSAKNITTKRPKKKLDHKWLGPYEIVGKVNDEAWKLQLGPGMERLHPVFHSSLLEPYHENIIPGRTVPPTPPVEIDDVYEYYVEEIIDSRIIRNKLEYRVSWLGYGPDHISWEPLSNVQHSQEAIKKFHEKYPEKPTESSIKPSKRNTRKSKR